MSLETLIPYIVQHNALIIQFLVSAILLLVVVLAFRNFSAARSDHASPVPAVGGDMAQLEATLKKLLEKANQVPSASSASTGDNPALLTEIEKLKKNLEEKQGAIERLKVEADAAKAGGGSVAAPTLSSEERGQLETQIKDLQAKLSEYEIISEDIADLSFYKEENVKLQKEIESIKKGGAPAGATAAAPSALPPAPEAPKPAPTMAGAAKATAAAAAAAEVPPNPAPVADPAPVAPSPLAAAIPEPVESASAEPAAPAAPPVAAAPAAKVANPHSAVDEDLMAEFAAAVEQQKKPGAPSVATPEAPVVVPGVAPEKAAAVQFAPTPEENPLGSGLDVDKIAGEVTQLEAAGQADVGNSLEGELNSDKLLEEAATMDSIKPEDAKLMNEFEDFVKKGGVG